jgi:hypothetical protein
LVSPIPAMAGIKAKKVTGQITEELYGYDFVNLVSKLAVFYVIAFLISKYMEAVIYFKGGLETIAGFFGIKFVQADRLPKQWIALFIDTEKTAYTQQEYEHGSVETAGKYNPPGWTRDYDYGTLAHQEAEPHLFPQKEIKYKFWDLVNAIVIFYIGWEAYKYYKKGGRDFLTLAIFSLLGLIVGVLSFSKFLGVMSMNKFQEENK